MLPRPSRLKSLASEFSPVFTTPPPVEPKTVFVLMSVPEMMLSSNLVPLRRRAAMMPAMPPRIASAATPSAQFGVLDSRSAKNPGGSDLGAGAAFGAGAFGAGADVAAGGVAVAGGVDVVVPAGAGAPVVDGEAVAGVVAFCAAGAA